MLSQRILRKAKTKEELNDPAQIGATGSASGRFTVCACVGSSMFGPTGRPWCTSARNGTGWLWRAGECQPGGRGPRIVKHAWDVSMNKRCLGGAARPAPIPHPRMRVTTATTVQARP